MSKGLQKIHFTFEEAGLTCFAGLPIICQFANRLQLKRYFQMHLCLSHRNTYYHWADLLLCHFYFTIAGIERFDHLVTMRYNGLLPSLTGLHRLPGTRAMRDFLYGITLQDLAQIKKLHDTIRSKIFSYPKAITTALIDFDSSVLTVYGNQEGAEIGYNPAKHGRASYHPIFGFESHLKISLDGELRPGKRTNKSEALPFIKGIFSKIPASIATSRTRARFDAGFYCWPTIKYLVDEKYGFVMVAQMTVPVKFMLPSLRYHMFNRKQKLSAAEFHYQPQGWKQAQRFVVTRFPISQQSAARESTLLTIDRYEYHVYVTNLKLDTENIWYFYKGRAAVEINIKELKQDFFMGNIPTSDCLANQAHLQLLLLDYDLFRWFQLTCLPQEFQSKTLKWIRRNILSVPGKFSVPGHQNILRFPKSFILQKLFHQIYKNAGKVRPLLK